MGRKDQGSNYPFNYFFQPFFIGPAWLQIYSSYLQEEMALQDKSLSSGSAQDAITKVAPAFPRGCKEKVLQACTLSVKQTFWWGNPMAFF